MKDEKFYKLIEDERLDNNLCDRVLKGCSPFLGFGALLMGVDVLGGEWTNLSTAGVSFMGLYGLPVNLCAWYFMAKTIYRDDICDLQEEKTKRGYKK